MARAPSTILRLLVGLLVIAGLLPLQLTQATPDLVAERFVRGGGYVQMGLLALYAAWLLGRLLDRRAQPRWRRRLWALFSFAFFAQLLLGLAGLERFLMSGQLHWPIPALIAAGPAYRGEGLFMPVLFLASVLLLGPAWCSHLCYLGAWDHAFARHRRKPVPLPGWTRALRLLSPLLVVGAALLLGAGGVGWVTASALAGGFGLLGVAVMALFSRRTGAMVHCTTYCPIGPLASLLGRLNPMRMRIDADCDGCGSCSLVCRYNAVTPADLERKRVGPSCTLCGDCVRACRKGRLHYSFPGLGPDGARNLFLVLAVSLHALFLGVAMI